MPRSGSTWLFNAVRLLLQSCGGGDLVSGWIGDLTPLAKIRGKTILAKVHRYDPRLVEQADAIIYSYRDLRDVMASRLRKNGKPVDFDVAARFVGWDRRWKEVADYVMRYEDMASAPLAVLDLVACHLDVDLSASELMGIQSRLDSLSYDDPTDRMLDHGKHHPENLLHRGHVTDGRHGSWSETLERDTVRDLEREFARWFADNHYPL